ncbi:hypothetical protein D3C87_1884760 [compost metagenome]
MVKTIPATTKIKITVKIPMPGIYKGCPVSSSKNKPVRLSAESTEATIQTIKKIAPAKGTTTKVPFIR